MTPLGVDARLPVPRRSRCGDRRGRGVIVVAKLSEAWGVRSLASGKTVWVRIPCDENECGTRACPHR
ncbi:hypothetical protein BN6_56130 [Saccharothrix espanaensis DSM 44229]|uniref:Histidine kinase/HSP90-like ATPase domain-containing protein n=1 Tax=Saccharothrix espanaensis (strain ATCC 51144 / DSM 44229 / JCM 9112 / NBRC 15066 / NRRL 15764) TaxID=1179773 RepID=K0K5J2_SACES|nr:hypothetical protein BN6_56130 [Saccharothrix espanaensis DSM 44229]